MLIIQKNTHKVVLVYERAKNYHFLPKGRKDVGESLEQAALREAYEEVSNILLQPLASTDDAWHTPVGLLSRVHETLRYESCPHPPS